MARQAQPPRGERPTRARKGGRRTPLRQTEDRGKDGQSEAEGKLLLWHRLQ